MTVADTLEFLLGRWSVERRLSDLDAGRSGTFDGAAWVEPTSGRQSQDGRYARYREAGRLRLDGYDGAASRGLLYHGQHAGSAFITFADGRPFVECDLRSGAWDSEHVCGDDHYAISFLVCSADELREVWRVRGPAKAYDAETTLRRIPKI